MEHLMYVTGAMNGLKDRFLNPYYPYNTDLKEDDILFQLGDFGFIECNSEKEKDFLDYLAEEKPYTIAFIDGDQENFMLLNQYPVETWNGGKAHVIRRDKKGNPKIVHLMRGQVFIVFGKRFFVLGGAETNHKEECEGEGWRRAEYPTFNEILNGLSNLCDYDYKVDYVLTHTLPEESLALIQPDHRTKSLNEWLEYIRETASYDFWYMGHVCCDCNMWRNQKVVHFDVRNVVTGDAIPYDLSLWGKGNENEDKE